MIRLNIQRNAIAFIILSIIVSWTAYVFHQKETSIKELEEKLNKKEKVIKSYEDKLDSIQKAKQKRISYVRDKFELFNKDVKRGTLKNFVEVSRFYGLDTNKAIYTHCISQICVESSARHIQNGRVIKSSGNALGICQIVPTTAYHYLKNRITAKEKYKLYEMGAESFDFIKLYDYGDGVARDSKGELYVYGGAREKVKNWLKDERNNMLLWGYMMRERLNRTNNLSYSLIAYNRGMGYLKDRIKKNKPSYNHPYIKRIRRVNSLY